MSLDVRRIAAAVHYVIASTEPGKLGYVKLNKILWYSDLEYCRWHGGSITGLLQYTRTPQGPMAKEISLQVRRLAKEGKVAEQVVKVADYVRREMISLAEPDVSDFTPEQIGIFNRIIQVIAPLTANQLTQITHADSLWKELENNEAMLVSTGSVISRPAILK